ncbi:MAG TPA: hypothetical protein VGQ62_08655 [Chloroflexota bacterium]|nr:hypothetical protein [Chloroflexota bacterium]
MAVESQQSPARRSSDELKGFLDELFRRLRVFIERSATIPPNEVGSPEWLAAVGASWRQARERDGLAQSEIAQRLGVDVDHVRFQELGLLTMQDLSDPARAHLDLGWSPKRMRSRWSAGWVLRHVLTIGLAHVAVLLTIYFLLLLGDALFTSYAIVLRDAVFVSYVAQLGWLQRMASDVKATIAFIVGLSALLQMLVFLWRVALSRS